MIRAECEQSDEDKHQQERAEVPEELLKVQTVLLLRHHIAEEECYSERERDEEIDIAVKRTEQNLRHTCPAGKGIPLVADSVEHEKESACKKQSRGFGAVDFRVVVQREKNVYYHAEHKRLAVVILVREHEGD